jgi:hypothetical protein
LMAFIYKVNIAISHIIFIIVSVLFQDVLSLP